MEQELKIIQKLIVLKLAQPNIFHQLILKSFTKFQIN